MINKQKVAGALAFSLAALTSPVLAQQKDYPIQPVVFTSVHVNDNFWQPKMEVNATVTIPYVLAQCKANGRMDNFLRAAKKLDGDKLSEFPFDDTDVYKAIEGASYSMQNKRNPQLDKSIDSLISIIGAAQDRMAIYTLSGLLTPKSRMNG